MSAQTFVHRGMLCCTTVTVMKRGPSSMFTKSCVTGGASCIQRPIEMVQFTSMHKDLGPEPTGLAWGHVSVSRVGGNERWGQQDPWELLGWLIWPVW